MTTLTFSVVHGTPVFPPLEQHYSEATSWEPEVFPAFHEAAKDLRGRGFVVLNPAEHDEEQGFDSSRDTVETFDIANAMHWDISAILRSDAMVLLPGWETSKGVGIELTVARAVNVPVLLYPDLEPLRGEPLIQGSDATLNKEVRVVAETGGAKGQKAARFDLLPWDVIWADAEHYGYGARKYADRNWERGYQFSLSIAALGRHFAAFCRGEDIDPESGNHHMTAVRFHAAALIRNGQAHPEMDDRP